MMTIFQIRDLIDTASSEQPIAHIGLALAGHGLDMLAIDAAIARAERQARWAAGDAVRNRLAAANLRAFRASRLGIGDAA